MGVGGAGGCGAGARFGAAAGSFEAEAAAAAAQWCGPHELAWWLPYANADGLAQAVRLPAPLAAHEASNLVLGLATLLHATRAGGLRYWLGFALFGLSFELVGLVARSHLHAQYVFQLTWFIPLKEGLWYAMTIWPSFFVAHQLRLSALSESMLAGLLEQLVNLPYEMLGDRPGIQLLAYNRAFMFANVGDRFMGSHTVNVLANLFMPWFASGLARWCLERDLGFVATVATIGLSLPVGAAFFAPLTLLKLAGCVHFATPGATGEPAAWVGWYAKCMTESAVSETAAWSLILTVFSTTVLAELLARGGAVPAPRAGDFLIARAGSLGPWPLLFVLAQLAEYAFLAITFDQSKPNYTVSTLICYVNLGIIYAALLFHVEQVLRSGFASKRR